MGIDIEAKDGPVPRSMKFTIFCDCATFATFEDRGGYIEVHDAAIKAGWGERQSRFGREWACPACMKRGGRK
jgi:hypothetical protein